MPWKPEYKRSPWLGKRKVTAHQESEDRVEYKKKYHTAKWKTLRNSKRMANPLCEECERNGVITAMYCVDHKIPIRSGGSFDDWDNLQSLCRKCHDIKSGRESRGIYSHKVGTEGKVIIVYGPPGSGKTYWAQQQKFEIMIDIDLIFMEKYNLPWYKKPAKYLKEVLKERDRRVDSIAQLSEGQQAIVVTTNLNALGIKRLMNLYEVEIKKITSTPEQCIENIMRDDRRKDKQYHMDLVLKWFDKEATDPGGRSESSS